MLEALKIVGLSFIEDVSKLSCCAEQIGGSEMDKSSLTAEESQVVEVLLSTLNPTKGRKVTGYRLSPGTQIRRTLERGNSPKPREAAPNKRH